MINDLLKKRATRTRFSTLALVAGLVAAMGLAGCLSDDNGGSGGGSASIYGIEPGAGMSATAVQHMDNDLYGLASAGWDYLASSEAAMLTQYENAVNNGEYIVVTAWSPHFMFAKWTGDNQMVYLEDAGDPNNGGQTFYQEESDASRVATLVSNNLQDNHPEVTAFLENFQMTDEDESQLMLLVTEGATTEEVANQYLDENPEKIEEWLEGVDREAAAARDGEVRIVIPNWSGEEIRSYMVQRIIEEELGYTATLNTNVDPGACYQAIASDSADIFVGAWLPIQRAQYDQTKDDLVDLADNLAGPDVTFGLAVPKYVYDAGITTVQDLAENTDRFL